MKRIHNTIIPCSYTTCLRGTLCPNFTPRSVINSFNFPSCMYNPMHTTSKVNETMNANKQSTT